MLLLAAACSAPLRAQQAGPAALPVAGSPAQDAPDAVALSGDPITAGELQAHVDLLAGDALRGRQAGSESELEAAAYIVAQLSLLPGIEPDGADGGWLQPFALKGSAYTAMWGSAETAPVLPPEPPPAEPEDGGEEDGHGGEGGAPADDDEHHPTRPLPAGTADGNRPDVAHNVLARLPGSDPALAHEAIVVGAHYDHVGFGEHGNSLDGVHGIHNGADDNASGSAVLLELAEALATAPQRPRRTILFQWYSGEELGLLGSRHWVEEQPTWPLQDVVAMLNLDMVGRLRGGTLMVGGLGSSPVFDELVPALAGRHDLALVLDRPGAAPSDNTPFYLAGVPALFFFTGLHEDYHRVGDDPHKLVADGAARVGRYALDVLLALDERPERPPYTRAPGSAFIFNPRPFWGLTLDDPPRGLQGAEVVVLVPDSPAGRAGMAEGDVVVELDSAPITGPALLERLLKVVDDRRTPRTFTVLRKGPAGHEELEFEVRPEMR